MLKYTDIYILITCPMIMYADYRQMADSYILLCLGHATTIKATGVVSFSSFLVLAGTLLCLLDDQFNHIT